DSNRSRSSLKTCCVEGPSRDECSNFSLKRRKPGPLSVKPPGPLGLLLDESLTLKSITMNTV
ncbi:hypothetical protein J6590_095935, partial [Homalodisca vitripennis]